MNENPTISLINETTSSSVYINDGQKQIYRYEGPAPPSYWDSPISASQLIVTIILLGILCLIYSCSNLDDDDDKYVRICTCERSKNVRDLDGTEKQAKNVNLPSSSRQPPPQQQQQQRGNDHNIILISELENRLRQLERINLAENFYDRRHPPDNPGKTTEV